MHGRGHLWGNNMEFSPSFRCDLPPVLLSRPVVNLSLLLGCQSSFSYAVHCARLNAFGNSFCCHQTLIYNGTCDMLKRLSSIKVFIFSVLDRNSNLRFHNLAFRTPSTVELEVHWHYQSMYKNAPTPPRIIRE